MGVFEPQRSYKHGSYKKIKRLVFRFEQCFGRLHFSEPIRTFRWFQNRDHGAARAEPTEEVAVKPDINEKPIEVTAKPEIREEPIKNPAHSWEANYNICYKNMAKQRTIWTKSCCKEVRDLWEQASNKTRVFRACRPDGYFKAKQCSPDRSLCVCVDKYGDRKSFHVIKAHEDCPEGKRILKEGF